MNLGERIACVETELKNMRLEFKNFKKLLYILIASVLTLGGTNLLPEIVAALG